MSDADPQLVPRPSAFRGWIGVARRGVTPPDGIFARNWGAAKHETASGLHRPLTLTCLTFKSASGADPLVLAGADLGWWRSAEDERRLRGAVLEALRLDPARLMICLSHTHAGPGLDRESGTRPGGHLIAPYLDAVRDAAIDAARAALAGSRAATLTWRSGRCDLAVNRDLPETPGGRFLVGYNPDTAADDTLLVGRVSDDASGRVLATVVNYACHPTTLAWENAMISPDYVGAMRETVEAHTSGAPCLFLQGASGELSPAEQYTGDVAVADRHGRRLGFVALSVLESMDPPARVLALRDVVESGAPLAVWRVAQFAPSSDVAAELCDVEFALKPLPPIAEIERRWRSCDDPVQKERLWRQRGVRRIVGDGVTCRMPLWTWRLGDSYLIGQPNEAYSEFQQALRLAAPRVSAVAVIGLVNGAAGYLPPREWYGKDVYSVWQTPFEAGSLERLIDAASRAVGRLAAAPGDSSTNT